MSVLDRYLAREILLPLAAGLLFLTQILLATQILAQADVLFGAGVSVWDVARVALHLTPHFLSYVLPVAFLLGCVVGVGRLGDDREIVALSAAGISPTRLVKVPVLLAVVTAAVALWLSLRVEPSGLRGARLELNEIVRRSLTSDVRPGVFFEEIPDLTLYVERVSGSGWRHVLISDRSDPTAPMLALAQAGRLEPEGQGETMRLLLERGELHRGDARGGEYVAADFGRASITMGIGATLSERNRLVGSPFELTPGEIVSLARESRDADGARRWTTFLHRRISAPLAVLAFALLAVPIGASRRGGRAFAYGATLLTVVAYYALLRFGEGLSQRGALPVWLGPNLPNLAVALAGVALTALMARRGAGAVR